MLGLPKEKNLCLLDSCGVNHLGSHLLIAGFDPIEILEISESDGEKSLAIFDEKISASENLFAIFTLAYEFGLKLEKISPRTKEFPAFCEPDIFLALFDCLIIHDYDAKKSFLVGNENKFDEIERTILNSPNLAISADSLKSKISSNFTRERYIASIERIKERIRRGDTYQTNLTQQIRARLPENLSPEQIFLRLRRNHPAPFASFLRRKSDAVVSASPERFFSIEKSSTKQTITTSPIKGTRPRGKNVVEDLRLRDELINSEKDCAENVMIVDLLRNDIGRICGFGSVRVEKLCGLEEHPTLFHLVSTISGELRSKTSFGEILKAVFPCGSITGAPKISTMRIIDEIETAPRGLSMGAIGYSIPNLFGNSPKNVGSQLLIDLSVAIRTMVVRDDEAIFNVGGGIVIDSEPESEYRETLLKARALLSAINAEKSVK